MKFITITGPDASGKDTQIEKLSSLLKAKGFKVQSLSIQNSIKDFSDIADMKTINSVLNVFLLKFAPEARSYFLLSLLKNSIAKLDASADVVLCNSYWYKYAASEQAYGVNQSVWTRNVQSFPVPDLTVILQASWESCQLRRSQWSPYESGGAIPVSDLNTFQKSMRSHLFSLLDNQKAPQVSVNADRDEDSITNDILNNIVSLLKSK